MIKINPKGWPHIFRWAVLFPIFLFLFVPEQIARADPPDMYAQNQSILIEPDGLHIDWKIAPGPVIADAAWQAADLDHNGSISPQEVQAWVAPFLSELSIAFDGGKLDHYQVQSIHWPAKVDALRNGDDTIEIVLWVKWPRNLTAKHLLEFHNAHLESNTLSWFSIQGEQGLLFDQPAQDAGLLRFNIYFPDAAGSSSVSGTPLLTSWDSGIPNLPGFTSPILKLAVHLANPAQAQTPPGNPASIASTLSRLVKTQQFSPLFLTGAFLLSLLLGSLHALTPGHGKTLVAAYLVGSKGRIQDAAFLGLIVTLTHTGSVLLLGLVTLLASHYVLPSLIAPWLEIVSGLLVVGFGINLLIQRRGNLAAWSKLERAQKPVGVFSQRSRVISIAPKSAAAMKTTPLAPSFARPHEHEHPHHEEEAGHNHEHAHALSPGEVTWKSLLTLGVSGGLIPCPDAIALLLVAVAVNRIPFGMLLIVAFSIGLAIVLIGIGVAMVQGARLMERSDLLSRFSIYTPVLSALVVSGLGIALTISALNSLRFSSAIPVAPPSQPVSLNTNPSTLAPTPGFDIQATALLYIGPDSQGRNQLFALPFSGGSAVQYTQEADGIAGYTLSPDEKTILYTVFDGNGDSSIWAITADGKQKRPVVNCPQMECDAPQWYADGQRIVYERLDESQASLPRYSIWWVDLQTGKTQPVFQDQNFASYAPRFSPDGQWLSYISPANNMLQIYQLNGGKSVSVNIGSQPTPPGIWSPGGDSILIWSPASQELGAPLHVKKYDLKTGQTIDLDGSNHQTDYFAAWSPDGQWIAIDRQSANADNSDYGNQIWLVKADGSGGHVLLDEAGASYSDMNWSADGKVLVYSRFFIQTSDQNVGHFDVYMMNIPTGSQTMLAPGGDYPVLMTAESR